MPKPREVSEHGPMPRFLERYAVENDSMGDTSAAKRHTTVVTRLCEKIELVDINSWYAPQLGRCNLMSIENKHKLCSEHIVFI